MSRHLPFPAGELEARLMCNDPQAHAWKWLENYLENINDQVEEDHSHVDMDELIDTALTHVDSSSSWGGDYISKGGSFEGFSVDPTFWDKLAIVLDKEIPDERRYNFFSCSC